MPKATRKTTTTKKTNFASDPASAAVENYRKRSEAWLFLAGVLDEAELKAAEIHGERPSPLVVWRNHRVDESGIDRVRDKLLSLPGIDPKAIEPEYWDAKARLMGTELAGKEWDERAGLAELRRDHDRAASAEWSAAWKLAKAEATTVAGASAFLTYISTEPAVGLFELGETEWHETAFRTVAAALAKITRQSQRAA
jgi:hypothetical protein